MKKYKSMFVLLGVLAILVAAYFLMNYFNKEQQYVNEDQTYSITNFEEIISMEYTDGEKTMSFSKEDEKWNMALRGDAKLDTEKVNDIADVLKNVTAIRVLEDADEISAYGLDAPKYTITMESKDSEKVTLYIGNEAGSNYYATIAEKTVIYVIDSTVVDSLVFDIEDFISQE